MKPKAMTQKQLEAHIEKLIKAHTKLLNGWTSKDLKTGAYIHEVQYIIESSYIECMARSMAAWMNTLGASATEKKRLKKTLYKRLDDHIDGCTAHIMASELPIRRGSKKRAR